MTLEEAYRKLGLRPLEEFAVARGYPQTDRQLGSTTWMVVEAALYCMSGETAIIIGHDLPWAERMATQVRETIDALSPVPGLIHRRNGRKWTFGTGGVLHWESERTIGVFRRGRPKSREFSDLQYREYLKARLAGPYGAIHRIDWDGTTFKAYSATGEYLLTLEREGAEALVNSDPYRIERNGW